MLLLAERTFQCGSWVGGNELLEAREAVGVEAGQRPGFPTLLQTQRAPHKVLQVIRRTLLSHFELSFLFKQSKTTFRRLLPRTF